MDDNELRRLIEATSAETRRHFDVVSENLESRVQLLAERVGSLDESLSRGNALLREEMRGGFHETQAMIKFSHAELSS